MFYKIVEVKKKSISDRKEHKIRIAAPLFVTATKNSSLASKFKEEVEVLSKLIGWKFNVIERNGRQLKDLLR